MTFGIQGESLCLCLCFEYYSPVLALASLGLERFCEKDSAILKKRALTFTVTWHSGKVSSVFETTLLSWHLWHWD